MGFTSLFIELDVIRRSGGAKGHAPVDVYSFNDLEEGENPLDMLGKGRKGRADSTAGYA